MAAVIAKRLFTTGEAQDYLALKRRTFEMHIAPLLRGKGVKIGPSVVYERSDIDTAWNKYKMSAGEQRPGHEKGGNSWGAKQQQAQQESIGQTKDTMLTASTGRSGFENVASLILSRPKHG